MGVGRNLAYHKHLFFDNKGFSSHIHLMSGDDDLFINQVANSTNTQIVIDPESFVFSNPKIRFNEYIHQKSRHLSVGKYYRPFHKTLLTLPHIFNFLLYSSLLGLILVRYNGFLYLILFVFYELIAWLIYNSISRKLRDPILGIFFPFLFLIYQFYLLAMSISGLFYKAKTWK